MLQALRKRCQALPSVAKGSHSPRVAEENNGGDTPFFQGRICLVKDVPKKNSARNICWWEKKNVAETQEMDFLSSGSFVFWQTCRKCKERTLKLVIGYFGGEKIR